MSRYVSAHLAEQDLTDIRDWYRKTRGPTIARQVLADSRETLRQLARNPDIGHPRADLAPADTLFWPHHDRFLVIFLPKTSPLQILRIWDARRGDPGLK